jgi:4-oxalocrotonate tautomerase
MPLARIDLSKDAPPERVRVVSEAIYHAMVEVANVPPHDKFQVITRHAPDEIIYPEEGHQGACTAPSHGLQALRRAQGDGLQELELQI